MKTSINIATFPSREECIIKMLNSVKGRFDHVRVYVNKREQFRLSDDQLKEAGATSISKGKDLTDNGKFYFLDTLKEDEYYFTADDDLTYHASYCEDMVKLMDEHNCIVTHHGRTLLGENRNYYRSHKWYSCLSVQNALTEIDVAGTGVTAFSTKYFKPKGLANHELQKMSDLIFSKEAALEDKVIKVVPHNTGYFNYLKPDVRSTIHYNCSKFGHLTQNDVADEIYRIKKG